MERCHFANCGAAPAARRHPEGCRARAGSSACAGVPLPPALARHARRSSRLHASSRSLGPWKKCAQSPPLSPRRGCCGPDGEAAVRLSPTSRQRQRQASAVASSARQAAAHLSAHLPPKVSPSRGTSRSGTDAPPKKGRPPKPAPGPAPPAAGPPAALPGFVWLIPGAAGAPAIFTSVHGQGEPGGRR